MATTRIEAEEIATNFLREQADLMKKFGETPKLSGKRYDSALQSITRTFESIASVK